MWLQFGESKVNFGPKAVLSQHRLLSRLNFRKSDQQQHVRVKSLEVGIPSIERTVVITNPNGYSWVRNGVLKIEGQKPV